MARLTQRQRIFVDLCSAASSRLQRRVEPATAIAGTQEQVRKTAAIFFAKTKMGWTERVVNKHAKKDGKPFLVDDARQRLIEELDRVAARKSNISLRPD